MFPKSLDYALVLFYTPEDDYGELYYTTGEPAEQIRFLAICKYEDGADFYLFGCNSAYEVVSDSPWDSIDECKCVASNSYGNSISWIAMD